MDVTKPFRLTVEVLEFKVRSVERVPGYPQQQAVSVVIESGFSTRRFPSDCASGRAE